MPRIYGSIMKYSTRLFVDYSVVSQSASGNYTDVAWSFGYYFHLGSHNLAFGSLNITGNGGTGGTSSWSAPFLYHEWQGGAEQETTPVYASGTARIYHNSAGQGGFGLVASTGNLTDSLKSTLNTFITLPTIDLLPGAPGPTMFSNYSTAPTPHVTASWAAPAQTGSGLTGVQQQIAGNSSFSSPYFTHDPGSWGTSTVWNDLVKGFTYYFRTRARTSAGWGPWSATSQFTPPTTVPSVPGLPTFSNITPTSLKVTWTASADNGGRTVTYRLQRSTSSSMTSPTSTTTTGTSVTITGLSPGTTYYFRVRAENDVGNSAYSPSASGVNVTMGATTPGAPATPTVGSVQATSAAVTYTAPSDDGGSSITGYEIQRATDSGFTQSLATFSDAASPYTLTGLLPSRDYWVRVRALNSQGPGAWSPAKDFRTLPGVKVGSTALIWKDALIWKGDGSQYVLCQIKSGDGDSWQ